MAGEIPASPPPAASAPAAAPAAANAAGSGAGAAGYVGAAAQGLCQIIMTAYNAANSRPAQPQAGQNPPPRTA